MVNNIIGVSTFIKMFVVNINDILAIIYYKYVMLYIGVSLVLVFGAFKTSF